MAIWLGFFCGYPSLVDLKGAQKDNPHFVGSPNKKNTHAYKGLAESLLFRHGEQSSMELEYPRALYVLCMVSNHSATWPGDLTR